MVHLIFLFLLSSSIQPKTDLVLLDRIENDLYIAYDTSKRNGFLLQWIIESEDTLLDSKSNEQNYNYPELLTYSMGGYGPDLNHQNYIPVSLSKYQKLKTENRKRVFQRKLKPSEYNIIATLNIYNTNYETTKSGSVCYGVVKFLEYVFAICIDEREDTIVACLNIQIPTKYGVGNLTVSRIFIDVCPSDIISWSNEMINRVHII